MSVILSVLPIVVLLFSLLAVKMSAIKASALAFLISALIFFIKYQSGVIGMATSMAKGCSLALFVVLIIWSAMFLYNLVKEVGALDVIDRNLEIMFTNRFIQFILLSWVFSAFLQGIAGFGVPVIVVTPILIALGFDPVVSVAAVLVGHSWSISFGSMGSSIYAIGMVTHASQTEIVVYMAIFGWLTMFCTGLIVCLIYGGPRQVIRGLPYVVSVAVPMGIVLYILARMEMFSVTGLLTGLTGLVACFVVNRIKSGKEDGAHSLYKSEINLFQSVLPYVLIVVLSIAFYIIKPGLEFAFSFDGYTTGLGEAVAPEEKYVTFNLLKYPFSIIMMSSLFSMVIFFRKGVFSKAKAKVILSNTAQKCISTTITIVFLLNMAVIMMDSGMINTIAEALVSLTGDLYPLAAPVIGLLGAFITGSNTNSNVIFGYLQEAAASSIGMSAAIMCAAQSIGASIGCSIGPTTVSLGATAAQIQGKESMIYRKTLVPILITATLLGIMNFLIIR